MLGKVDPKAAQANTATVDLTKGPSVTSRCAGFLFNKTTAVGTGIVAVGTVALNSIYSNVANNASTVAKAVVEAANPFLPTCPLDSTICGLLPDAIAEATGLSTVVKVGTVVAGVLLVSGVAIMKMRPAAPAPAKIDQPAQEPKAAEEVVGVNPAQVAQDEQRAAAFQANVAALIMQSDAVQQNAGAVPVFNEQPNELVEPLEPTSGEIRGKVADLFMLSREERAVQLAAIPEGMRELVITALRNLLFKQKVFRLAFLDETERAVQLAAIPNAAIRALVAAELARILK
jgi:hypothetical protein